MVFAAKDRQDWMMDCSGARDMDFTGKPMKGSMSPGPDGFDSEKDLDFWVQKALGFNATLI